MDVTINLLNGERIVGVAQNAKAKIHFLSEEPWTDELLSGYMEYRPVPALAFTIAVTTDLVYFLDDQEVPPYTIVALGDGVELWRCEGCRLDPTRPGRDERGKHGRVLREATFLSRSYSHNGEKITVPGD